VCIKAAATLPTAATIIIITTPTPWVGNNEGNLLSVRHRTVSVLALTLVLVMPARKSSELWPVESENPPAL